MSLVTLPPKEYAIHVFATAVKYRSNPSRLVDMPVVAVRRKENNYTSLQLFDEVSIMGESDMKQLFDHPLFGSRGVIILFTKAPLKVVLRDKIQLHDFDMRGDRAPDDLLKEAQELFYKHKILRNPHPEPVEAQVVKGC